MSFFYDNYIYKNPHKKDLLAWKYFTENIVNESKGETPEDFCYDEADSRHGVTVVTDKMAEWISSSFARVNIYFRDITVLEKGQSASYKWTDLLADVGGILGLWVGVSFITIFEFMSLFGNLMMSGLGSENKINGKN